jgi:hypothetical protein
MNINRIPARYKGVNDDGTEIWVTNIYALTEVEFLREGIDEFNYTEDPIDEANWINSMLEEASEHGLLTEVVQFALKYQRENPEMTPAMAMRIGFCEWVK